jgi:hypothetical protein
MDTSVILSDVDIMGRMGDVDILGDDHVSVLEALGAVSSTDADNLRKLAVAMQQAREVNPQAVAVRNQLLRRMGSQLAGTVPLVFTAGTPVQTVTLQVTRPFLPKALTVGSEIAPFFRINNIQINGVNQLGSTGSIACSAVSEAALVKPIKLDTVNTSLPLTMEVQMTDLSATRTFLATFFGIALLK